MDCGKVHVMNNMIILLSWKPVMQPQIKPLLIHTTVRIVLAYLNFHAYTPFVVVCTLYLLTHARYRFACLSVAGCCLLLAITIITTCILTSIGHAPRQKEEWLNEVWYTGWNERLIQAIFLMFLSCIWGVRVLYSLLCTWVYLSVSLLLVNC